MTIREYVVKGKKNVERRYFSSSLKDFVDGFSSAVRKYLGVESTHWVLDVVFKEDGS